MDLIATNHAYDRAKERFSWRADVLDKMMVRAFKEGIRFKDTKGQLARYIRKNKRNHPHVDDVRIYGQNIYFFSEQRLITLYRVPTKLIKYLKLFR